MVSLVFLHGLVGSKNNFVYLEKYFSDYKTILFDLIGFGNEAKPKINYNLDDFLSFLDKKLELSRGDNTKYILVGHSLGALLAKEVAYKFPNRILRIFLLGYPFLDKSEIQKGRRSFDGLYIDGVWWTKIMCEMRLVFQILFLPLIYLFRYKYRKSYLDYFKHTYQSAYGTINNVILKDNREKLFDLTKKVVFINGQKDVNVDLEFTKKFKHYFIESMGHTFFNHEGETAKIIKTEIEQGEEILMDSQIDMAEIQDQNIQRVEELYEKRAGYYDILSETGRRHRSFREFFSQDDNLPEPGSRVLDAGCGTGLVTQAIIEALDQKKIDGVALHGFDLTPAMLAKFEEWKTEHNRNDIRLHKANVLTLNRDLPADWKDFDFIVSANMLEHIPREQLSQALRNLRLLLSENGRLEVFIERESILNKTLVKLVWGSEPYKKEQIVSVFKEAGLKILKIEDFGSRLFKCFAVAAESGK